MNKKTAFVVLIFSTLLYAQSFEIYVSDVPNFNSPPWQILKFDENGNNPEVFLNTQLAWPQDIVFIEEQQIVLISNLNSGRITKYNSTSGAYIGNFATAIGQPTRMKIGADSLLYVLQWAGNGKVKRYKLDGTFVDDFTSKGVPQSIGLDWDKQGNLYVSSYQDDNVRKFSNTGTGQGVFINSNLSGPTNIWFDNQDNLFVVDYDGTNVKKFDSTGVFVSNFISGIKSAEGVAFLDNGDILLGNGASGSVRRYDSSGNYQEEFIQKGSGNLTRPNAVVIRNINVTSLSEGDHHIFREDGFVLHQNYPNPFNPSTRIDFYLPIAGHIQIRVYNVLGEMVKELQDGFTESGHHTISFNMENLPGGIYFYKLENGHYSASKKMIFLK